MWINWLKKDIKKLWVTEDFFIECLNLATNSNIEKLEDIPKDKIKDIEELMKKMVFHVIALNTVVKDIWEEKIWDDFDFSYNSCSKKTIRVAWTNKLLPTQVVDYVKNRKLYIMRLLDPRLKENPA